MGAKSGKCFASNKASSPRGSSCSSLPDDLDGYDDEELGSPQNTRQVSHKEVPESPRAPRPNKQSQPGTEPKTETPVKATDVNAAASAEPESPRAPRPHQKAPPQQATPATPANDEVDSKEFLTQVAKNAPSPASPDFMSPRSSRNDMSGLKPLEIPLLPPQMADVRGRRLLALDLDECLVHADRQRPPSFDFEIDVQVRNMSCHIYVSKRPGLDAFLEHVHKEWELILFTASMEEYGRAVLAKIDPKGFIPQSHVLARKQCTLHEGEYYVKDLSRLGRSLRDVVLVDDNPNAYLFQPENALPVNSWYDDQRDDELPRVQSLLDVILKSERSAVTTLAEFDKRLKWDRSTLWETQDRIQLCYVSV